MIRIHAQVSEEMKQTEEKPIIELFFDFLLFLLWHLILSLGIWRWHDSAFLTEAQCTLVALFRVVMSRVEGEGRGDGSVTGNEKTKRTQIPDIWIDFCCHQPMPILGDEGCSINQSPLFGDEGVFLPWRVIQPILQYWTYSITGIRNRKIHGDIFEGRHEW